MAKCVCAYPDGEVSGRLQDRDFEGPGEAGSDADEGAEGYSGSAEVGEGGWAGEEESCAEYAGDWEFGWEGRWQMRCVEK